MHSKRRSTAAAVPLFLLFSIALISNSLGIEQPTSRSQKIEHGTNKDTAGTAITEKDVKQQQQLPPHRNSSTVATNDADDEDVLVNVVLEQSCWTSDSCRQEFKYVY